MTRAVPLFTDFLFQMHSIISMSFLDLPARKTACWDRLPALLQIPSQDLYLSVYGPGSGAVHRISVGRHCIRQHPAAFRLQIIAPSVDPVPSGQHPAAGAEGVPASSDPVPACIHTSQTAVGYIMEIIPVSVCRILEPSSHHGPIAGKPEPGRAFLALARIRIVDIGPFTGIGTPAAGKDPPSRAILYPYACDASFGSLYVCRLFPPGGDPRRSAARRVASGAAGARWTVCPVLHFEIQDHCDLLLLIPGAHNSRCSFLCRIRIFLHGLLDPSGIHCRRYQPVPADGQKLSVSLPLQLRPVLLRFPLRSLGIQNCRHLLGFRFQSM